VLNLFRWQDHGTFEVLLPRRTHSQSRAKQVLPPLKSCRSGGLAECGASSLGAPGWWAFAALVLENLGVHQ